MKSIKAYANVYLRLNKKEIKMSNEYEYPEGGIEDPIEVDEDIYDRGYSRKVDEGTWYEVYVSEATLEETPTINLEDGSFPGSSLKSLSCIRVDDYEDYGQITFFVPNDETFHDLDFLTDLLG